jgi:peroxiredoxin
MKRILFAGLLSCALTSPAMAALPAGDVAPDFQAQASLAGNPFNFTLKEALKKGAVVVYFYPSAYTGGCNIQAHEFAANHDKFTAAGASVIGVSLDDISRLNAFSADPKYCACKVAVAADVDGKIAKAYDLTVRPAAAGKKDTQGAEIQHGFVERTTFVIASDGKIAATLTGLSPAENVAKALAVVEQLDDSKKASNW